MTALALATDFAEDLDAEGRRVTTLQERLRLIADSGFTHVHWCEDWNNARSYAAAKAARLARLLDAAGLACIDVHGTATAEINLFVEDEAARARAAALVRDRVEFCARAGGDAVVLHVPSGELAVERALGAAEALEDLIAFARAKGVRLAAENGGAASRSALEALFDRFGPDALGFCFDSGHANIEGTMGSVERHGSRLAALHLADNDGERDLHRLPFDGTVPWERAMRAIREAGYAKPVCLEVTRRHYPVKMPLDTFVREAHARAARLAGLLAAAPSAAPPAAPPTAER